MKHTSLIAVALTASMLAACTEPDGSPGRGIENGGALSKEDIGVGVGVVGGGLIGSAIGAGTGQVVAVIVGGLLGGALGGAVGNSLDNADRAAYNRASQHALETGRAEAWNNPDSGNSGNIMPHRRFTDAQGRECRHYTQTIYIDGERHQGHGTACRQDDGTWAIAE